MSGPSFLPASSFDNFTPESISIPEDPKEQITFLKSILEQHARFLNRKDTGQYEEFEVQINQTFPGSTPQTKRDIYRLVIDFGALPNAANKTVAHNIANVVNIIFTRIYGVSSIPGVTGIPLPFANPIGLAESVALFVDATNVNVTTGTDRTAFTTSYVVLEYFRT